MANKEEPLKLNGLARRLVNDGLLDPQQALTAQNEAAQAELSFVSYLVKNTILASPTIAHIAGQEFGIPLFDLDSINPDSISAELIQEKLIRQHHALPLYRRDKHLYIAISDPSNLQALDAFQFSSGLTAQPLLVDEQKLATAIHSVLTKTDVHFNDFDQTVLDTMLIDDSVPMETRISAVEDTPVVRFINGILHQAIQSSASDIHFEPYEKHYRVRLRIDGLLHDIRSAPVALGTRIAARLKVLSQLNIAERRLPQDGRMRLTLSKTTTIDFRVNTCPTLFGEKIVLRILDASTAQFGIDSLGYENEQKSIFMEYMHKAQGMILVTGPTGSGKTVSLYTALNILNTGDRNISTAEDPAEISLPGINQVNVHPHIGLTFSECLRAFLRQDPDVIMVGEIRDLETAEIAIKAAQTGHLVFSTLHTNDAPQTLTRLANMGVPAFNIASAVSLIIAQRLVRRLCNHCKQLVALPTDILLSEGFNQQQINDGITVYKAVGCEQCTTGYKGRIGIYQVMPISAAMRSLIINGGHSIQLAQQGKREGIPDLRVSGLKKVAIGLTSIEEINRVIKE